MQTCACAEHACSGWGPTFTIHTPEGPVALCRHCFTMGHNWRSEMAHMSLMEELKELYPEGMEEHMQEYQRDADRFHGRG
jgi:hypothetical protein